MIQKITTSGRQHELPILAGEKFPPVLHVLDWIRRDFGVTFDVAM